MRKFEAAKLYKVSYSSGAYADEQATYTLQTGEVEAAFTYVSGASTTLNEVYTIPYNVIAYTKDARPVAGDKLLKDSKYYLIDSVIKNARYRQLNLKEDAPYAD